MRKKLRRQLLRDLFHGAPAAGSTLDEINEYYGYHFHPGEFNVLIIRLNAKQAEPPIPLSTALEWMDGDARMFLATAGLHELETLIEYDTLYILINFSGRFGSLESELLHQSVDRLYHHIDISRRYHPFYFALGDGLPVHNILDAGSSMLSARNAVDEYGINLRQNRRHDSAQQMYTMTQIMNVLTPVRRAWFAHHLETLQLDALEQWVDDVFQDCQPFLERFPTIVFQLPYKILDLCLDAVGNTVNNSAELQQILLNCRSAVDTHQDYSELAAVVKDGLAKFIAQYDHCINVEGNPAILQAKNFMWHNYAKKLTLDAIADHVHLNPQYFSVLFKRETGESVTTHLTNLRVEQAKTLLKDTTQPINEISREVGYDDPDYFSRLFRKTTGTTPRQYRAVMSRR